MPEIPPRLTAALSDRYRIEREIGSGGMATVYQAQDLKHDRKVAVKVLRPELAAVLGAERFVQEIKTTANLQHPHILPLFDSGEADSFLFYVMPFIDGETLREKLDRETQLGIDEALRITTEVADALDYAHRQNVIHRDIKPENVLLHDGRPVVADFGIALAVSAAAGGRMTETGLSLGTPHYMSPEQATAEKELSNRSDIYSLGAMLYEMLTGSPPHVGSSAQQIIMKIVVDPVRPVTDLRKSVPNHVAAATAVALEKLPADRFASAKQFAEALADSSFTSVATVAPAATIRRGWTTPTWVLLAISVVLFGTTVWSLSRSDRGGSFSVYDVGLLDSAPMSLGNWIVSLSVSPAGDFMVYRAAGGDAEMLWYRSLVDTVARPIAGTEGALTPAVSPSGEMVAFTTAHALKTVPTAGGHVMTLADLENPTTVRWISETQLLVNDGDGVKFRWVDVETGSDRLQEVPYCILPQPLPGTDLFLCGGGGRPYAQVFNASDGTYFLVKLRRSAGGESVEYLRGSDFRLVDDEFVTYMSVDGNLRAVPFDPVTLEAGRPVTMIPGVRRQSYTGAGQYGVSRTGTMVYVKGANGDMGSLVRWNEGEEPTPLRIDPAMFLRWDLSPGEQQLAMVVAQPAGEELRVYRMDTGGWETWLRGGFINNPLWIPTGDIIVGQSDLESLEWAVLLGSPTAAVSPDTLFSGVGHHGYAFNTYNGPDLIVGGNWGDSVHGVVMDISASSPRMDTILAGGSFLSLSPDGRNLVYQTAGLGQVVVSPFPAMGSRVPVSRGGIEPRWRSATELVYWERGGSFYRVSVSGSPEPNVGVAQLWHHDPRFSDTPGYSYSLTADGGLLYVQEAEQVPAPYVRVIPNWVDQMKRAVEEANR